MDSAERLADQLWNRDPATLNRPGRLLLGLARLGYALARDLGSGQLSLRAMSLVYTTLLSLVPLLAVSFSVLKGFGVHNQLEPLLLNALSPLGEGGAEISARIIEFVDRMQVGVLGSLGLGMLLYTVIALIQKIEQAFNYTWRVTRPRPLGQRFTHYLSVLMVGPVLFFSALGVSASLSNAVADLAQLQTLGPLFELARVLAPYAMISLTFAFVYVFVPNTRVRLGSALIGALAAGLLWEIVGGLFATFMAGSTSYAAIYSGLAILILLMIWIYLGWMILLVGASIAFYHQHPEYLSDPRRDPVLSARQRERLALRLATSIAHRHAHGQPPLECAALARQLAVPETQARALLEELEGQGILLRTAQEGFCHVPARNTSSIALDALLDAVHRYPETQGRGAPAPGEGAIDALVEALDAARAETLAGRSLADLVAAIQPDAPARPLQTGADSPSAP
ncbi:MAG: YihY/virulence factor BrkB family protein [Chromatiaceae bacterium]|nr:YihY/virulence factor BrkB family protein [Chromatiaceae bacterium]